jgi:hypothetical protein
MVGCGALRGFGPAWFATKHHAGPTLANSPATATPLPDMLINDRRIDQTVTEKFFEYYMSA